MIAITNLFLRIISKGFFTSISMADRIKILVDLFIDLLSATYVLTSHSTMSN